MTAIFLVLPVFFFILFSCLLLCSSWFFIQLTTHAYTQTIRPVTDFYSNLLVSSFTIKFCKQRNSFTLRLLMSIAIARMILMCFNDSLFSFFLSIVSCFKWSKCRQKERKKKKNVELKLFIIALNFLLSFHFCSCRLFTQKTNQIVWYWWRWFADNVLSTHVFKISVLLFAYQELFPFMTSTSFGHNTLNNLSFSANVCCTLYY